MRAFAAGIRTRTKTIAERFDADTVWTLRSELLALDAYLRANPKAGTKAARRTLGRALPLAGTIHAFESELRGFQAQKASSERASLFDLSSIGILSIENVLTAERPSIPRIVMSALAEGLMYFASRQYVGGSTQVLQGLYRQHAAAMYGELWTLATDYRGKLTAKEVREVQGGIDAFFAKLEGDGVPVEVRVAILNQFYALLLTLRVSELLDAIGG